MDLSEKIDKLDEKNGELEERTKELEAKEVDMKAKIDEMAAENIALQERVTVLEQQLNAEAESKLKEMFQARDSELDERLTTAEKSVGDHDKLFDRLESCEKKLASFYGEDTNILGRVGHLETRFKDFKNNEDIKLGKVLADLSGCQTQGESLQGRVQGVEDGVALVQRLCDILEESKVEKSSVEPILLDFKSSHRLLNEDSIIDVTTLAHSNKDELDDLAKLGLEKQSLIHEALDRFRADIEELQKNTEPAHKYECFGSDQAVKIFQIEEKLAAMQGLTAESVENRLQLMDNRIDSTKSQMDRVLTLESFITSNFDRIGTDYVHLSRLISDINEELSGHDQKMQNMLSDIARSVHPVPSGNSIPHERVDNARLEKLSNDVEAMEHAVSATDRRMSNFIDECKNSVIDVQSNTDKKIDILAVWVSKNINLLAASMRKKFKQLMAGDNALLTGHNNLSRTGHCISCNQTKRPYSASHPKTKVVEGKSPIFKISHVDHPPPGGDEGRGTHGQGIDTYSEATDGTFRMTVPSALRMKVSNFRQGDYDDNESFQYHGGNDGANKDEGDSRKPK